MIIMGAAIFLAVPMKSLLSSSVSDHYISSSLAIQRLRKALIRGRERSIVLYTSI